MIRFNPVALTSILLVAGSVAQTAVMAAEPSLVRQATQQESNEPTAPANDAAAAAAQQNAQSLDRVAEQLVRAMDQLIPGSFSTDSPLPAALKQSAMTLLSGDADAATAQLQELKLANASLPPAQLLMAAMYFSLNQGELGRLALERAAVDQPDYPGVFTALARLSINQGWWASAAALLQQLRQKIDAGQWNEEEKKHFESEYLDALADTAIGQRRWDDARGNLQELRKMLPENASVPFRLADIDFRQSNIDSALEHLNQARALDAKVLPPELVLYQWSARGNKSEETARWIDAAATKYPEEVSVQLEYARHMLEKGDLTKAAEWVGRAEKNASAVPLARFLRGQIAFLRRAYQVAEADFRELLITAPNDMAARNMLALCLIESDDSTKQQKALELANGNFQFNPSSVQAASTLAWVMYRMGNTQQARQILTQLSGRQQVPAETAFYISRILMDEDQDADAVQVLQESLKTPGLFLYRSRAEEDLTTLQSRLQEQKTESAPGDGKQN